MQSIWKTSIRFTLLSTLVLGCVYPLTMTGIAKLVFPGQASGSLIRVNGAIIGSSLIGQSFPSDRYFHSRPSAAGNGYDATSSGGSNLAQSNSLLINRIQSDIAQLQQKNSDTPVPIDLATASASGLDPDITPDAAYFQVPLVAKARGVNQGVLRSLIARHIQGRQWGVFGEPRVNVLQLNLALDAMSK